MKCRSASIVVPATNVGVLSLSSKGSDVCASSSNVELDCLQKLLDTSALPVAELETKVADCRKDVRGLDSSKRTLDD